MSIDAESSRVIAIAPGVRTPLNATAPIALRFLAPVLNPPKIGIRVADPQPLAQVLPRVPLPRSRPSGVSQM